MLVSGTCTEGTCAKSACTGDASDEGAYVGSICVWGDGVESIGAKGTCAEDACFARGACVKDAGIGSICGSAHKPSKSFV